MEAVLTSFKSYPYLCLISNGRIEQMEQLLSCWQAVWSEENVDGTWYSGGMKSLVETTQKYLVWEVYLDCSVSSFVMLWLHISLQPTPWWCHWIWLVIIFMFFCKKFEFFCKNFWYGWLTELQGAKSVDVFLSLSAVHIEGEHAVVHCFQASCLGAQKGLHCFFFGNWLLAFLLKSTWAIFSPVKEEAVSST